jgi:murein DD-endopeptidase MepM/ murein hydrolase activator NlpD
VPAIRARAPLPAPAGLSRTVAVLLTAAAVVTGPATAALAAPTPSVAELTGRIAAVDDDLAELAEAFAVLDVREAELRRHLDHATSRVDRLTQQRAATRALHQTQLDLAHRRSTVEQVDEALHTLMVRSGLAGSEPDLVLRWLDDPPTGGVIGGDGALPTATDGALPAATDGALPTVTSASVPTTSATAAHPGHLQLRYAVRASVVFAHLHLQLAEAEQATAAPRGELDTEVAPARAGLQERLQELLAERATLAGALAFERSMLERGDRLQLPVTGAHRVSSRFGMRRHPIHGDVRMHTGLDLAAPIGTPVSAAAPGRVVAAGSRGGYGLTVDLDHGDGLLTRYAHLDRIDVSRGERLAAGQQLGTIGMTGTVTGPHLHLEVREHGRAVDPADWLEGAGGRM